MSGVPARGSGRSLWTGWKDQHVPLIGQKVLAVAANTMRKRYGYSRLVVIDLTAGYGVENDGRLSVGTVVLDYAADNDLPVDAFLCEADTPRFLRLQEVASMRYGDFSSLRVTTLPGECKMHETAIVGAIRRDLQAARKSSSEVYGLLLADPCGFAPWDTLQHISAAFPRIDILLYLGAATIKWFRNSLQPTPLAEQIERLAKREIYLSPPHGNYQWTALLLSNFAYGPSAVHQMQSITTGAGREWWDRITMTREERKARLQPSLWSFEEEVS